MNKILKRFFSIFVVFATIFLLTNTAKAAASTTVTFDGCDMSYPYDSMDEPCSHIMPEGMVVSASSDWLGLFSFRIKKGLSDTTDLSSIAVNIVDGGGASGTLRKTDIAGLAVFKSTDDMMGGGMYAFPDADKIGEIINGADGDQDEITAFTSGVSANTIDITTTNDNEEIPTTFWGENDAEYYVAIKTSSNWSGAGDQDDQISFSQAVDWITVTDGTLGTVFTGPTSATEKYYAAAPDGWEGAMFSVTTVDYMGTVPGGTNQEIEVRFSDDVDETSAILRANYNIGGTNPLASPAPMMISPMAVRLTFAEAVTITPNQTSLVVDKDITSVVGGRVLDDTSDITMIIMGMGGDGGMASPLMISEVMIGTASSGLEEFIELYNPQSCVSGCDIDFSNMNTHIWINTSSGHTKIWSLTSGTIAANGYFLIAAEEYTELSPAADTGATYDASAVAGGTTEGALRANSGVYISTNSTSQNIAVIDRLGWGSATGDMSDGPAKCSDSDPECEPADVANNGKSLERKANHSATATTMALTGATTDGKYGNSYTTYNNQWDFIQRTTADPQNAALSGTESQGGAGFGDDNTAPYINHEPLYMAPATNDLIVIAEFMDDAGQLASGNAVLYYRFYDNDGDPDNGVSPESTWNPTTGTQTDTGSSFYRFTIPSGTLDADQDLDYFLRAYDGTYYTCLPSPCDASNDDLLDSDITPYYINVSAAGGNGVISGVVQDSSNNPIPDVMVYAEGMPFTATTNSSGYFSLEGLTDGVYDITARGGSYTVSGTTANYLDGALNGIYLNTGNPTSLNNTLTLYQGIVESYGGTAADQEPPIIMWSAPNDGMQGYPEGDDLIVVFDRAMQSSAMTGGSATTDNIYLIDSSGVIVAGTVTYYADSSGRSADLPSDPYLLTYGPDSDLSPGASYTLVLTERLIGQSGVQLMGNRPSGGHSIGFTVAMDYGSMAAGATGTGDSASTYNFGSGASFPPYVMGTTPGSGGYNISLNTKINITFNEAMSSSVTQETVGGVPLNITMHVVSNPHTANETETAFTTYAVTQNTAGDMAILTPDNNLAASTHYRVKVLSNCTSADGTPMSNGDNTEQFRIDFDTGDANAIDATAPTVAGTYPSADDTGVPNNLASMSIGFSEAMDAGTINARTVQLKRGTTAVAATVEYDVADWSAYIMPTNALRPGASYTITVVSGSSGVKDLAGNALVFDYTASFTTDSTADSTAPSIEYARCDDYSCSITFSEPMKSARVDDSANFAASILKPTNYVISGADFSSARAEYDQMNNTVRLEGISDLSAGQSFTIIVSNVEDKAGNGLSGGSATFSGTVENSMATGGMMGPGGNMMMGPTTIMDQQGDMYGGTGTFNETGFAVGGGGGAVAGSDMTAGMGGGMGFDFGGMWMEPVHCMPMNMMAGATAQYTCEFKADSAIESGGTIKITFPTGTDVSSAAAVDTSKSMPNKDINGPMDSTTVTIATVTNNPASRTVTVTTSGAIAANNFIMFDLGGIKNPTVPKSHETNGYTADIKTFSAAGALLQSETTMPFFINAAGDYTLSGTITTVGTGTVDNDQTVTVYLDSWMTGPMEATATFANGSADYSFTGLNEADYHIRTEPTLTLEVSSSDVDYSGYERPESVRVDSSSCTNTVCDKDFSITKQDSANAHVVAVQIYADFSGSDFTESGDREVDIWAGGPGSHTMKTVTLAKQDYTTTPYSTNLYLSSTGEYWVGMGPAMPKGMMMMGPPPMPAWMPPQDIRIEIGGTVGSTTYAETSGTDNDGTLDFTVGLAANEIIGYVVDSSGTAISNVDVDAHRTQGGFGMPSHAQTDADGQFVLKVTTGIYEVNAWMPGLPWSPGRVVDVRNDDSSNDDSSVDGNDTADVYKNNGTTLVTDAERLLVKLDKSSTTISGQLLDDSDSPVAYSPVWAYSETTGEHMPSGTDSSGNYTIYVGDGTWYVEAFIPGLGDVSYSNNAGTRQSVTVSGSSVSGIDIRPASDIGFATITGTIANVTYGNIWVEGSNPAGGYYHNGTNVNSSGEYRLKVPTAASGSTTYQLHAWLPDYGDLAPISIAVSGTNTYTGGTDYTDFSVASMKTLTLNFIGYANVESGTEAFVDVFKPGDGMGMGKGNHTRIDDLYTTSSTTLQLPADTGYEISVYIPGIGGLSPTCADDGINLLCTVGSGGAPDTWQVVDSGAATFDLTALGDLYTFTVTINTVNASSTTINDSFVWLGSSSFHSGEPANSSGVATLTVPAGTYELGADKPGYTSGEPTTVITSTDSDCDTGAKTCTKTISLTANLYTLSGTITDSNGDAVPRAWIWADKVTSASNFAFAGGWTGTETNPDGTYELSISDGFWMVRAVSDANQETSYTESGSPVAIQVDGVSLTGKDIIMSSRSDYAATEPKSVPITPASGGTIDDFDNTGVKITIPASALGTDTSSATLNITDTYTVPSTGSIVPLGGKGKNITASNSSGQAITSLSGSATVEINYDSDDLPSGVDESNLMLVYFDNSSNQWIEVPSSQDTTNDTLSGATTHFTTYAVALTADGDAPTTPGTPTASSTSASATTITWTASTDTGYGVAGYEVMRSTDGTNFSTLSGSGVGPDDGASWDATKLVTTNSYTDSGLSASTTYYYQVIAWDNATPTHNNSASSSSLTVTTSAAASSGGGSSWIVIQQQQEEEIEPEPEPEPEITTESKSIAKMSISEIKAKILEITGLIANLQASLVSMISSSTGDINQIPASFSFTQNLKQGMRSNAVKYMQIIIGTSADGIFGPKTKQKLIEFQEKYKADILEPWNLEKGTGIVGKTTRAKLNNLLGR